MGKHHARNREIFDVNFQVNKSFPDVTAGRRPTIQIRTDSEFHSSWILVCAMVAMPGSADSDQTKITLFEHLTCLI